MNDKTQHAIAAAGFVTGLYAIYIGGNVASGLPMPDGTLFAGVLVAVGVIFGFKLAPMLQKR